MFGLVHRISNYNEWMWQDSSSINYFNQVQDNLISIKLDINIVLTSIIIITVRTYRVDRKIGNMVFGMILTVPNHIMFFVNMNNMKFQMTILKLFFIILCVSQFICQPQYVSIPIITLTWLFGLSKCNSNLLKFQNP